MVAGIRRQKWLLDFFNDYHAHKTLKTTQAKKECSEEKTKKQRIRNKPHKKFQRNISKAFFFSLSKLIPPKAVAYNNSNQFLSYVEHHGGCRASFNRFCVSYKYHRRRCRILSPEDAQSRVGQPCGKERPLFVTQGEQIEEVRGT